MDATALIGSLAIASNDRLADRSLRSQRAHLIGIAGSGMRAMADVLTAWGWHISGSDSSAPAALAPLSLAGEGKFFHGHAAEHVAPETELVIYSDAIPASNPELRRAAELGIPTLSYFQMLGRLCVDRHTVAIAGTHGKSTTTAMTAHVLVEAGHDPTVFCGATPLGKTSGGRAGGCEKTGCHAHACRGHVGSATLPEATLHAHDKRGHGTQREYSPLPLGEGQGVRAAMPAETTSLTPPALTLTLSQRERGLSDLLLIEACEYRANFLKLRPTQAAILGIEPDHFDCYDSLEQIEAAFRQFAALLPPDGLLLVRHDCCSTRRATANLPCRIESFGLNPEADWSAHELTDVTGYFQFTIHRFGQPLCEVRLQMPGRHNVLNALAAAALAWANGATADQIGTGLSGFAGLHRRLEVLGTWRGVTVVDDYAHHPTEVAAALQAVRGMFPRRRVWCVFQPHQACRTARLLDELAASLQNADKVLVAEIFRAREGEPRPGEVTAADLARQAGRIGVEVLPIHTAEEIVGTLETHLVPGDVLVTLGAGDVARLRPDGIKMTNVEIKMTKEGRNTKDE